MSFAHPLTQHGHLPVSPIVAAFIGVCAIAVLSYWNPRAKRAGVTLGSDGRWHSWEGDLSRPMIATRVGGVAFLVLCIASGRFGEDFQLENLAPALVVGVTWPLLLAATAIVGPVWRWIDPWDAIARWSLPGDERDPVAQSNVHWAAVSAFAWVAYAGAFFEPLDPRAVGTALAAYSIVTVAGCLALGRVSYLARAELFGLLFGWVAHLPRRALSRWTPPAGAELVLGVLAGGLLFGALRRSEAWGSLDVAGGAALYAAGGVFVACALGGGMMVGLQWWADRRGARGAVAVALVPAVASLAVALALERNVFFTSIQLLPGLLGDPFGWGWDLLGKAGRGLNPAPLGATGLVLVQLAILVVGHVVGALAAAGRVDSPARMPATIALCVTVGAGTIAVMSA